MASFKQVASQTEEKSLLPAIQTLVHGLAVHTVKGDPDEDRQFRNRMHSISEAVSGLPTWMDTLAAADSAVSALRDHNERTNKYQRAHVSELRAVIQMLGATLEDLAIASPGRMKELREIQKLLAAASSPAAVQESKISLATCLGGIREEAQRYRQNSGDPSQRDPVTGLEARPAAEIAITQACESDNPTCAVVVSLDRLSLYNRRYGRDVGDKVLRFFVEFVGRSFDSGLSLFRWTGPAVLMLRHGSPDGVQAEMRRAFDPRLEFEVDSGSRSILLTIGVSWSIVPMMVDPRLVVNKIDAFVSD